MSDPRRGPLRPMPRSSPPTGVLPPDPRRSAPRPKPSSRVFGPAFTAAAALSAAAAMITWRAGAPAWALPFFAVGVVSAMSGLVRARLARRLVLVSVRGVSMTPAYQDGDRVWVRRDGLVGVGQVVVVERPAPDHGWSHAPLTARAGACAVAGRQWMIKRVAAVPGDRLDRTLLPALANTTQTTVPPGRLVLLGDNPKASFDSRDIGYFPVERILGTAQHCKRRRA